VAAVDLDASVSADSLVSSEAAVSWALAAAAAADSVFAPPMLLATRAFSSSALADSVFTPPVLQRARPMAAPVVADSLSVDAVRMTYALASSPLGDSLGAGALSRARPLGASPLADTVFAPAMLNSTDGLLAFVIADTQVAADLKVVVPLAAGVTAGSAFAIVSGQPDIYRMPLPNRPQPLPPPAVVPLRIVPNPPKEAEMSFGTARTTRREGL